jgi:SAM-dependent methyltransferase
MPTAAERWRAELAAWVVDPEILAAAPESPYGCTPDLFPPDPTPPDTPSRRCAREALPAGGSVLDVGCGAGAAAFALVPPAARLVGVDQSPAMLAAFAATAAERGVEAVTVEGRWPDVADRAPDADVVVCHHVAYNVPDLAAFALALSAHARRRAVVELSATHPWSRMAGLWRHFHGQDRPDGPSADLAAAVLRQAGLDPNVERFAQPPRDMPFDVLVAFTRRRLCLPYDKEPEVADLLRAGNRDEPRETVTLWWDVSARLGSRT